MKRRVDRLVLVLLSSLLVTTGLLDAARVSAATPPTSANAEALMAQRATRGVGGRGAREKASRLPSKAGVFVGGGGLTAFHLCDDLPVLSSEVAAFKVFPPDGRVELGKPHVDHDLMVHACPPSSEPGGGFPSDDGYVYRLMAPDGEMLSEIRDQPLAYDFSSDAEEGEYQLLISGPSGDHRRALTVSLYPGPRMELVPKDGLIIVDPMTGGIEIPIQDALEVRLSGFSPGSEVEVALYQVVDEAGNVELSDSWVAITDQNGEYLDTLAFEPGVTPGDYLLVACALDRCDPVFLFGEPDGPRGGVSAPLSIVWEKLHVTGQTCRDEHIVRSGETLDGIAHRFGVTRTQLVEANPGNPDLFRVGQKLCIP